MTVVDASEFESIVPEADCIINATPIGLKRTDPLPLSRSLIRKGQLVCDLVYNPPDTRLLKTASSRGALTLRGIGMLLWEVIRGFQYAQTAAILLMLIVTVSLIDLLSAQLRKRLI